MNDPKRTERLTLRLDADLLDKLLKLADNDERTLSTLTYRLLRKAVAERLATRSTLSTFKPGGGNI